MKKSLYICGLALIMAANSCNLNREDYTEINTDLFPKTETDAELAVNSLYYYLGTGWGQDNLFAADRDGWVTASEMTAGTLKTCWGNEWDKLYYQQWTGGSTPDKLTHWYARYNTISRCRNTIRTIEKMNIPDNVKREYIGEAEALRGMMMLYMYDFFGSVPVASDEVLDQPQTFNYLSRATDDEYDTVMETDLRDAISVLPEKKDMGRMTKGTAMMTLLKYYMIRGKYSEAEALARQLYAMEGSVYSLLDDPSKVFDYDNMDNKEVIYRLSGNLNVSRSSQSFSTECLPADFPFGNMAKGWGGYLMPISFYETFEKGDRRTWCLYTSYVNNKGVEKKGWYDENGKWTGDNNLIIYRFSDVILTLAECIARNNHSVTDEAVKLVNRIRNRAGLGDLSAEATSSYDNFMEALFMERLHELYHEGSARQDEIRFGKFTTLAKERAEKDGTYTNSKNGTYNRFPIPEAYITESKGAVKQTEGY